MKLWLLFTALAVFALVVQSCAGGSPAPAAAPAPPTELPAPAVLKFVDAPELKIDLGAISSGASPLSADASAEPSVSKAPTVVPPPAIGERMPEMITLGPDLFADFSKRYFDPALTGISELGIPVNTTTTRYEVNDFRFLAAGGYLQELGAVDVKVNFAPFDYDNNGVIDGTEAECNGNTRELPICVRLCVDGAPFIAGIFDEFPCRDNADDPDTQCRYSDGTLAPASVGKGTFKLFIADDQGIRSQFEYGYQQSAAQQFKAVTYSGRSAQLPDSPNLEASTLIISSWDNHATVTQGLSVAGAAVPAIKNMNMNTQVDAEWDAAFFTEFACGTYEADPAKYTGCVCGSPAPPNTPPHYLACLADPTNPALHTPEIPWVGDPSLLQLDVDVQYLGQYLDGGGYWSGSIDAYMLSPMSFLYEPKYGTPDVVRSGHDLCASLPPVGEVVDGSLCAAVEPGAVDIRVGAAPYVPKLDPAVVVMPAFSCDDPAF